MHVRAFLGFSVGYLGKQAWCLLPVTITVLCNPGHLSMRTTIVYLAGVVHAAYDQSDRPVAEWAGVNQVRRPYGRLKCRALLQRL